MSRCSANITPVAAVAVVFTITTAPVNMTYALHEALGIVLEEGLENRIARHEQMHKRLRAGLEAMGITYVPKRSLHTLNCINIPAGADDAGTRRRLLEEYGIGDWWRICVMAVQSLAHRSPGPRRQSAMLICYWRRCVRFCAKFPHVRIRPPAPRGDVAAGAFLERPEHLAAYESDGLTAFRARPAAVVIPETADEVIALVRFCHAERLPFVARGSGTSLSGGSLPVAGGIVIALNRLNRILKLDPVQRIAVVEPGVVNLDVTQAAAAYGLHFAPDPSSQSICTIGGNIAFNSGGAHCLKYGMTSNHVLGIKAVLGTGEVVEWGGPSRETVGPDWCGLFTGNEGLFGIALEITLQLLPRAECFHTVLAGYRTLEQAGDAVSAVIASVFYPAPSRSWMRSRSRLPWPRSTPNIRPAARPCSPWNSKTRAK